MGEDGEDGEDEEGGAPPPTKRLGELVRLQCLSFETVEGESSMSECPIYADDSFAELEQRLILLAVQSLPSVRASGMLPAVSVQVASATLSC